MGDKAWAVWDVVLLLVSVILFLIITDDGAWQVLSEAVKNWR